jgi:uncharacterized protein YbbC (DUF1343 family)
MRRSVSARRNIFLSAILVLSLSACAQRDATPPGNDGVRTGIDVLEADHFAELTAMAQHHGGKLRLGLLTNRSGVDANGRRTIDVLLHDAPQAVPGLTLTTLFSPEHGISGAYDQPTVPSSSDAATGLPVVSLYGSTDAARRPTEDSLRQLDAVAIDLQDVGVRFYTYEAVVGPAKPHQRRSRPGSDFRSGDGKLRQLHRDSCPSWHDAGGTGAL